MVSQILDVRRLLNDTRSTGGKLAFNENSCISSEILIESDEYVL
jgi:hypothetical protein